ncbi:MAG: AAA family ATPase [Prevotella sp.]|nr:AAA family ATPase [Prevotella sp.]
MKYADYIKEIEIDALWSGRKHIKWTLDPQVNILSGVNGDGKSTILRRAITGAKTINAIEKQGIRLVTEPSDAEYIRYNWICTPDVRSEYDENLQGLLERYNGNVNGNVNQDKGLRACSPEHQRSARQGDKERRALLYDIIDKLFSATHKTVDREKKEFTLLFYGEPIDLKVLSSGEKQMLTILLAVYLENGEHYVLFMDEPEVSLHVEWQKQLISIIRQLNPNVQIILSTHSPAMIMDGWMDKVTEVSEITV